MRLPNQPVEWNAHTRRAIDSRGFIVSSFHCRGHQRRCLRQAFSETRWGTTEFETILLRTSRAFSLIELLVVLAIIGILSALLLPVISRSKGKARQIQCVSNLHQLGLGLQSFAADNHAYPSGIAGTNSDNPGSWIAQLQRGGVDASQPKTNFFSEGVWRCPTARLSVASHTAGIPVSYGYNAFGILAIGSSTNALGLMGHFVSFSALFEPIKESEVPVPSDMMAIGDSLSGGVYFMRSPLEYLHRTGSASARHQGRVNVAFCDGHVESPGLKSVFQDTNDVALVRWNRDHLPHRERQ